MDKLFTPGHIGPVEIKNRIIRSAAFEAMCPGNRPSQQLHDYHMSVAEGGTGMTTLAYASVTRSGLSFEKQLWMRPEIVGELRSLTDDLHGAGAKVSVQLGHCGNMSHKSTAGQIPISASTHFNLYSPTIVRGMRDDEIKPMAKAFGDAVRLSRDSGIDCVEIHAGHGYLISQFLSPYTNHRRDKWGGSLDNRMNFMRLCIENVMEAAGSDMGVLVKMNMRDGFKSGMQLDETLTVAKELQQLGVHALVLSGGFVSRAPMYVMRGAMPVTSMTHYMKQWWLKFGVRMFGNMMMHNEPYTDLYFLDDARQFRRELPDMPLVYVGGCATGRDARKVMDEGFEFVQMGRALLADPAFANHIKQSGPDELCDSGCEHTNYCIARMYSREMACHHCLWDTLPESIKRELNQLKRKNERH